MSDLDSAALSCFLPEPHRTAVFRKYCTTCRHCGNFGAIWCEQPYGEPSPVNGERKKGIYQAQDARSASGVCGPEGKLWEILPSLERRAMRSMWWRRLWSWWWR